jgi:hypothetical protein
MSSLQGYLTTGGAHDRYQLNSQDRSGDVLFHALSLPFGWAKLPLLDLLEVRVRPFPT